jgi:hypothetical protein
MQASCWCALDKMHSSFQKKVWQTLIPSEGSRLRLTKRWRVVCYVLLLHAVCRRVHQHYWSGALHILPCWHFWQYYRRCVAGVMIFRVCDVPLPNITAVEGN